LLGKRLKITAGIGGASAFARSDLHQGAMAALRPKLRPATLAVWSCPASELPARWPDVRRRIAAGTDRTNT